MKHALGTKVRVLGKSVGGSLSESITYKTMTQLGQPFLYVVNYRIHCDKEIYSLGVNGDEYLGDFYREEDVELYVECQITPDDFYKEVLNNV